jgi:hypothetical protein
VPDTITGLPRLLFMQPLTVLMRQTRQAVRAILQSILLRCLWSTDRGRGELTTPMHRCLENVQISMNNV